MIKRHIPADDVNTYTSNEAHKFRDLMTHCKDVKIDTINSMVEIP